jgi:hypothetical protein
MNQQKSSRKIIVADGSYDFVRTVLMPDSLEDAEKLWRLTQLKSVIPLDEYYGLDILPFKVSAEMMLEIAFMAQNQGSYEAAQSMLARYGTHINDDTIRKITNFIGAFVFRNDLLDALKTKYLYNKALLDFDFKKSGTLFLETDGASLNTRIRDNNDSTWRENKLAIAFTSDDIKYRKNKKTGEYDHDNLR